MKGKTFIETGVLFHVIDTNEDFHSFNDLNLVLAPFVLAPAQPKFNYIDDIDGMDGSLDLSEVNGEIKYKDRDFSFTFTVFPKDDMTFEERQTFVSNALNGRRCKITLDKDPEYYFIGRCTVNEYFCDKRLRQIVITARVAPYKLLHHETVYKVELTSGVKETIYLLNRRMTVCPSITCTKPGVVITFKGISSPALSSGTSKVLNLQLAQGSNQVTILGSGTVTFTYREGDL